MLRLLSGFTATQIEAAIRAAIASLPTGAIKLDSDLIIPLILGQPQYVQDFGITADQSTNAAIGRDIRLIGERSGIIEKDKSVSKILNNSKTTVTRYKINIEALGLSS